MRKIIKNHLDQTISIKLKNDEFDAQAFFIDLDGTTLDRIRKKISKKNIDAIREKNKFYPVIISTGRAFGNKVKKLMKLIDIKYAICQNGAIIVDKNENILLDIKLEKQQIIQITKMVEKHNLVFTINSEFKIYSNKKILFLCRLLFRKKFKKINNLDIDNIHVNKIVLAGKNRKKIQKIYEIVKDQLNNVSMKMSAHDLIIEITHKNATKGNGAKFVSNLLNIDIKKTVHIGDSQNDTTTLNVVGALIAMKNSSNKLLDVATHIGPSYRHGGLAKVLNGKFEEIKR